MEVKRGAVTFLPSEWKVQAQASDGSGSSTLRPEHDLMTRHHDFMIRDHDSMISNHEFMIDDHDFKIDEHDFEINEHEFMIRDHDFKIDDHDLVNNEHDSMIADHDRMIVDVDSMSVGRASVMLVNAHAALDGQNNAAAKPGTSAANKSDVSHSSRIRTHPRGRTPSMSRSAARHRRAGCSGRRIRAQDHQQRSCAAARSAGGRGSRRHVADLHQQHGAAAATPPSASSPSTVASAIVTCGRLVEENASNAVDEVLSGTGCWPISQGLTSVTWSVV